MDDSFTKLSDLGKKWFKNTLGSKLISEFKFRDSFVLIAVSGSKDETQEKISMTGPVTITKVI